VDYSTTPQQLGEHFKSAGAVARVTIVGYPMAPQGYAYLEFESSEGKQAAIDTLDNTDFNGRTLKVGHGIHFL
jgi:polyadenylate-binding protein 2